MLYVANQPMRTELVSRRRFVQWSIAVVVSCFALGVGRANPPEGILDETHASVRAVMAIQGEVTPDLMKLEGILGTAVGLSEQDEVALVVYLDRDHPSINELKQAFPPQLRGTAVQLHLTDKFRALAGRPGGGGGGGGGTTADPRAKQTPPIQLGTSGGWRYDLANGYCCAGTLGSLIQVNEVQYILSNYHVLEADIVAGGNSRVATEGDPVTQPGLIDVGCNAANAQNVATLMTLSALPDNNVDCAVAQVLSGMVRTDGAILGIGTISAQTAGAAVNQAVKKTGRTSGLTRSKVSALNATISVAYDNECAGGAAFTKTFTGQIVIANKGTKFLQGGDSGSLMVEDVSSNARAVGLLYAGSSTSAIANPIGEVLNFVGSKLGGTATMVGN